MARVWFDISNIVVMMTADRTITRKKLTMKANESKHGQKSKKQIRTNSTQSFRQSHRESRVGSNIV